MKGNDANLWKCIKEGNQWAFNVLYDQHVDFLFSYGIQFLSDQDLVKDCIHDLFIDIYKYRKTISEVKNTRSYLLVSFKRQLYRYQKASLKTLRQDEVLEFVSEEASIEDVLIENEQKSYQYLLLAEALADLTEAQRACLYMRFNQDRNYDDIAKSLSISVESVRTKIYRAIKILRKKIQKTYFFLSMFF